MMEVSPDVRSMLEQAYLGGFNASGEGYNGEYPFSDRDRSPAADPSWARDRAEYIDSMLAAARRT